jgi:hypothetical protein
MRYRQHCRRKTPGDREIGWSSPLKYVDWHGNLTTIRAFCILERFLSTLTYQVICVSSDSAVSKICPAHVIMNVTGVSATHNFQSTELSVNPVVKYAFYLIIQMEDSFPNHTYYIFSAPNPPQGPLQLL